MNFELPEIYEKFSNSQIKLFLVELKPAIGLILRVFSSSVIGFANSGKMSPLLLLVMKVSYAPTK